MARVFTTKFVFNGEMYDAIVTMITTNGKLNFTIRLLDGELHEFLPGGSINYEGKEGFKHVQLNSRIAEGLVECIANSIEHHLVIRP